MRKKIVAILMAVMMLAVCSPLTAFASSGTVKMTVYDQVLKKGNTVYCAGAGGVYKVTLKNGKVKSKKRFVSDGQTFAPEGYESAMRLKGKYLYFLSSSEGTGGALYRIKTSGGSKKRLAYLPLSDTKFAYAIKGNKIYYYKYDYEDFSNTPKRVMDLNGKNKTKTSKGAVLKHKKSNAKGYSIKIKTYAGYYKYYLKTPKGSFYLGKTMGSEW